MNAISKLIEVLEHTPKSNQIIELIKIAESESSADITKQIDLLTGNGNLDGVLLTHLF